MMILFYQPELPGGNLFLPPEESAHCAKVLRKKAGDEITVVDGNGLYYLVNLTTVSPKKCDFEIIRKWQQDTPDHQIHIAVAPTKNQDRMEWMVEKLVEIGVAEISFILCAHSERKNLRLDRLEKKAASAMKQSLKATLPKLNNLVQFRQFVQNNSSGLKLIAHFDPEAPHLKDIESQIASCLLVGPEGDFAPEELELAKNAGFKTVILSHSRLRTETAAIAACLIQNL